MSGSIQRLPPAAIAAMVAGPVITDLASCVKELVDNAVDAGAQQINIRLFNKGLDIIEVSDDGVGIPLASRPLLGQAYASSKRPRSGTLGFRGAALYSLVQVARQVVVATRTMDEVTAQKLELTRGGGAVTTTTTTVTPLARKVGTTVAVLGFLHHLPVRQHDLQQRLPYYRHQLRQVLLSYILFHRTVKIHWMDLSSSANAPLRSVLRSPPGAAVSLRETAAALWGPTLVANWSDFHLDLSDWAQSAAAEEGEAGPAVKTSVSILGGCRVEGLISSLTPPPAATTTTSKGSGCYFGLDGRGVDLPRLSRLLQDLARTWFTPPRPCVAILHFTLPPHLYDVNLSPDKRLVRFLQEEDLWTRIRNAVQALWSAQQQSMTPKTVLAAAAEEEDDEALPRSSNHSSGSSITTTTSRSYHRRYAFVRDPQVAIRKQELDDLLLRKQEEASLVEISPARSKRRRLGSSLYEVVDAMAAAEGDDDQASIKDANEEKRPSTSSLPPSPACRSVVWNDEASEAMATQVSSETTCTAVTGGGGGKREPLSVSDAALPVATESKQMYQSSSLLDRFGFPAAAPLESVRPAALATDPPQLVASKKAGVDAVAGDEELDPRLEERRPKELAFWASLDTEDVIWASLRDRVERLRNEGRPIPDANTGTRAVVAKDDFSQMTILGQFNLGFILASTPNGNLWILDQHACDEIYNFESLRRTTTLYEQPLIAPLPLELSLAEEACILDHREIFTANGFRLQYNDAQPPRHRWSLTALPHSGAPEGRNAVQYGPSDVQALCAILLSLNDDNDDTAAADWSGNQAVRRYSALPKTIALWASRACRGSVMIGQALSKTEMERIVQRLAGVDDPWHCPHGRPTLCHVYTTEPNRVADERDHAEHVAGPTLTILNPSTTAAAVAATTTTTTTVDIIDNNT